VRPEFTGQIPTLAKLSLSSNFWRWNTAGRRQSSQNTGWLSRYILRRYFQHGTLSTWPKTRKRDGFESDIIGKAMSDGQGSCAPGGEDRKSTTRWGNGWRCGVHGLVASL